MDRERWDVWDTKNDRPASMASYYSEAGARLSIEDARLMVKKGHRPDLADIVDHLEPRRVDLGS